jgi:phosphoglucosamine mutase
MTADVALKVGQAAGRVFKRTEGVHRVVIGKDTRLSGYMVENALTAGFTSVGMDVFLFGPLPTPAVAMLTRSLRADLGVMISASHNPYHDNGIKLFGPDGYKLSDAVEKEIEAGITGDLTEALAEPTKIGRAKRIDDSQARYIEFVKRTFPRNLRLDGLRIVVDCANGAAYKVAPSVFWELGAEVISIGVAPDGFNINEDCGSTAPEALQAKVREARADLGVALDGDADRVVIVDEKGRIVDGDQILGLIGKRWAEQGKLKGGGLVATIMSNLGLERTLAASGVEMVRAGVGDRYVMEQMRGRGMNLGGEQSGHIILSDFSTTGDGLIAALQVCAALVETGKRASEVCHAFEPLPQLLKNVRYHNGSPLDLPAVKLEIERIERELGAKGRVVIRKSGTEPVIRVMAEGDDEKLVKSVVGSIVSVIEKAA